MNYNTTYPYHPNTIAPAAFQCGRIYRVGDMSVRLRAVNSDRTCTLEFADGYYLYNVPLGLLRFANAPQVAEFLRPTPAPAPGKPPVGFYIVLACIAALLFKLLVLVPTLPIVIVLAVVLLVLFAK